MFSWWYRASIWTWLNWHVSNTFAGYMTSGSNMVSVASLGLKCVVIQSWFEISTSRVSSHITYLERVRLMDQYHDPYDPWSISSSSVSHTFIYLWQSSTISTFAATWFSFLELGVPFSRTHDVIYFDTVDSSVVFSLPVKLTKKRGRTIKCGWLDSSFLCKEHGWPHCQHQAPTKSARPSSQFLLWPSCVITSSCDALGTFSQMLSLWKTRL